MVIRKLVFVCALLGSTAVSAAPAAQFLHKAIQGDNSEMRLGRLIAGRGTSVAVRRFGQTLVNDHSQARFDAVGVARRLHVRPPNSMAPEAVAEFRKLVRLHGRAFDREAARYMVDDHRKDIADFTDQLRHGDRATAALAARTLPTLRKHLRIALSLPR